MGSSTLLNQQQLRPSVNQRPAATNRRGMDDSHLSIQLAEYNYHLKEQETDTNSALQKGRKALAAAILMVQAYNLWHDEATSTLASTQAVCLNPKPIYCPQDLASTVDNIGQQI